jgi:rare lipoprotein A (peptidoglycan hydrolase)
VRLTDWCQCYRGERRERIIDLSDDAFARLAPLSTGVVRVTVEVVDVPRLPATDAE